MPGFFNEAFGGGLQNGARLSDIFFNGQNRRKLGQLEELFRQGDFNNAGAMLAGMGQVGQGVNTLNIPYQREQQALQRDFQNAQFQALQNNRDRQFELQNRPNLPNGYTWNDPSNPNAGVSPLQGYDPQLAQGPENWTTPTQAVDPETGQPVFIQTSNRGNVREVDGYAPNNPIKTVDTGTEIISIDSRTNREIGRVAKQNQTAAADKARGTALGKQEGENLVSAGADFQAAENALTLIDSLRNDPNRERGTGKSAMFNFVPYTKGYDFQNKVDQVTSGAFMTAIQGLRGMGALSNAEGQTATRAVTRLSTATSEEAFLDALKDYEAIVLQGRNKAAERMGRLQRLQSGAALPIVQEVTDKNQDRIAPSGQTRNGVKWSIE